MRFIVIIGFIIANFTAVNVMAKCNNKTHITDIPYAKNSSYFSNEYSTQLDDIMVHYQSQSGYLLLEFKVKTSGIITSGLPAEGLIALEPTSMKPLIRRRLLAVF